MNSCCYVKSEINAFLVQSKKANSDRYIFTDVETEEGKHKVCFLGLTNIFFSL